MYLVSGDSGSGTVYPAPTPPPGQEDITHRKRSYPYMVVMSLRTLLGFFCLRLGRLALTACLCLLCLLAGFNIQLVSVPQGRRSMSRQDAAGLPPCPPPQDIPGLGAVPIHLELLMSRAELVTHHVRQNVTRGGHWRPAHCQAQHRVAILVPYRDRDEHLYVFLQHLHSFLQKQLVHYGIYIIEQADKGLFNRARLMNIGFLEATKDGTWDCVIFHDVDLLPNNTRNLYYCPDQPRHYSVAVNTLGYKLLYEGQFGGAAGMRVGQFVQVNGYSNMYWGWGGEDDDMSTRIDVQGLRRLRYPPHITGYIMQRHANLYETNKHREGVLKELLNTALYRIPHDGLHNTRYTLTHTNRTELFTKYSVTLTNDLHQTMLDIKRLKLPHIRWQPSGMKTGTYEKINW